MFGAAEQLFTMYRKLMIILSDTQIQQGLPSFSACHVQCRELSLYKYFFVWHEHLQGHVPIL